MVVFHYILKAIAIWFQHNTNFNKSLYIVINRSRLKFKSKIKDDEERRGWFDSDILGGGARAELVRGADAGGGDAAAGVEDVDETLLQEAEHMRECGSLCNASSEVLLE